ncbi:MAG: hypothetical protein ACREXP_00230 [Steroidobacteraceae bacterium]
MLTQKNVLKWATDNFGAIAMNPDERAARLIEEAIEVCQAQGVSLETILRIAVRAYSRPVGVLGQEVGGCGIALLAMCEAAGLDAMVEVHREWDRVSTLPREHWQRKHAEKVAAGTANLSPLKLHPKAFAFEYPPVNPIIDSVHREALQTFERTIDSVAAAALADGVGIMRVSVNQETDAPIAEAIPLQVTRFCTRTDGCIHYAGHRGDCKLEAGTTETDFGAVRNDPR